MASGWRQAEFSFRLEALTRAEVAVLSLVDFGLSNDEIAAKLAIAVGTVKWHLHQVFEKLDARNRLEAVAKAREYGILPTSAPPGTQPLHPSFR
jgi:ATP/maltotriose-dependent transcriptional regulator MalT